MKPKPFSNKYVITETLRHMGASVDISISKTLSRLPEASESTELGAEILMTLANLDKLARLVSSIKENNKDLLS